MIMWVYEIQNTELRSFYFDLMNKMAFEKKSPQIVDLQAFDMTISGDSERRIEHLSAILAIVKEIFTK